MLNYKRRFKLLCLFIQATENTKRVSYFLQIVFGPNSTTLAFHMARSLGSHFKNLWEKEKSAKSDQCSAPAGAWQMPLKKYNLVVTNLEHDTNVSPFVRMAEDLEVTYLFGMHHSSLSHFFIIFLYFQFFLKSHDF